MDLTLYIARLLLAGVFGVAGLAKLADRDGSRQALITFGVPASLAAPFGLSLPVVELLTALALVPDATSWWGALAAFALLLLFTAGIGFNLAKGRKPVCHCFGQLDSAPIGWQTLVRNAVLAAIAGFILSQDWIVPHLAPGAGLETSGINVQVLLFGAIAIVVGATLVAEGWIIYRLYRRVAALESTLAKIGLAVSRASSQSTKGLPVGVPAPAFQLTGLEGGTITLDHLRSAGKPILLVFTDPACGPCRQLLPTLGRWQREHASQLTIVNLSRGSLDVNRAQSAEFGLKNVLLQEASEVTQAYRAFATPSALLVRADGTIGSTMAVGEGDIGALVQSAARSEHDGQQPERAVATVGRKLALN